MLLGTIIRYSRYRDSSDNSTSVLLREQRN